MKINNKYLINIRRIAFNINKMNIDSNKQLYKMRLKNIKI